MASSLFALLDDITTILDDVALLTKVAAQKTAGVVGDDLALNAEQLSGLAAQRELPVVWAVAKGSLVNKSVLVPLALALSALAPWAIAPLLMVGGAYLCLEGFEKLAHYGNRAAGSGGTHAQSPASASGVVAAAAQDFEDLQALERERVRGAIRTDFVLSAEIIVITLGTVQDSVWSTQLLVLSAVALLLTVGVYGLVAVIVKLDDVGLHMTRQEGLGTLAAWQRATGRGILAAAPWLMRALAVVGTAAMFMVGGGILVHGLPLLHALPEHVTALVGGSLAALASALVMLTELVLGVATGALVYGAWALVRRLVPSRGGAQ